MEEDLSFGSVWTQTKGNNKFSNTMVIGGEDFLTGLASTLKWMVKLANNVGDVYVGKFKNGLKHGEGK